MEKLIWYTEGGGAELAEKMLEGYKVKLSLDILLPPEIFLWSNKPLRTVADLKGLKIRTAGDDGAMFSEMGASVVFIPGGEVYEAMKRGVIDAFQLSCPAVDWTLGAHEVAKYCYLSPVRQPAEFRCNLVNADDWTKLPDNLKKLVEDEGMAEAMRYYAEATQRDKEALIKMKEYGTIIEPASEEIVAELLRQAKIFYDKKAAEDPLSAEVINSLREFKKVYRELYQRL